MSGTTEIYRVWCETEAGWVLTGQILTGKPTTCPTDAGHTITAAKTVREMGPHASEMSLGFISDFASLDNLDLIASGDGTYTLSDGLDVVITNSASVTRADVVNGTGIDVLCNTVNSSVGGSTDNAFRMEFRVSEFLAGWAHYNKSLAKVHVTHNGSNNGEFAGYIWESANSKYGFGTLTGRNAGADAVQSFRIFNDAKTQMYKAATASVVAGLFHGQALNEWYGTHGGEMPRIDELTRYLSGSNTPITPSIGIGGGLAAFILGVNSSFTLIVQSGGTAGTFNPIFVGDEMWYGPGEDSLP